MSLRAFAALSALVLAGPAFAQATCTPRETPDIASEASVPVLFSHCLAEEKCGAIDKNGVWKVPPVHRDLMIEGDFVVVPENAEWSKYGFTAQTANGSVAAITRSASRSRSRCPRG